MSKQFLGDKLTERLDHIVGVLEGKKSKEPEENQAQKQKRIAYEKALMDNLRSAMKMLKDAIKEGPNGDISDLIQGASAHLDAAMAEEEKMYSGTD